VYGENFIAITAINAIITPIRKKGDFIEDENANNPPNIRKVNANTINLVRFHPDNSREFGGISKSFCKLNEYPQY